MITCIIDKDGYIVNPCIEKKEILEEDICAPVLNDYSLIKPKWDINKEKWTEGATEQEIKDWEEANKPKLKEVSETKILSKEIANLKIDNMKKDTIINSTLKTVAELKVQIMTMKGGNE
ncbi:hypothetical protein FDC58_15765 [Clostridium botulinum]|nr:hypothetical protein [Clostridium botulinum]NFP30653.1 hypothetical protein [Clostridium botulinum]